MLTYLAQAYRRAPRPVRAIGGALLVLVLVLRLGAQTAHADDLVIDLNVDPPATVNAGENFLFVLEVFEDDDFTNDVLLQYFIPEGLQVVDVSSSSGDVLDCMAGTPGDALNPLSCRLGNVDEDDDPILIAIEVMVDAALPEGTIIDTDAQVCQEDADGASVPGSNCASDDFPQDNELHVFTTVTTSADLSATKQVAPAGAINAGESLSYAILVANAGPSVARGVRVVDTLPDGAIFRSAEVVNATGGGSPLGGALGCTFAPNVGPAGTVTCELGDVAPGLPADDQMRVLIEIDVDPGTLPTPTFTNNASVRSVQTDDPNPGNNVPEVTNEITDRAQVEVRKSSTPLNPVAGETFLYTFELRNLGPADARNVEFTDTLPQGLAADGSTVFFEYVDDEASGFCTLTSQAPDTISCRPTGNAFSNPPYVLPAGESVTFSVLVRIPPELQPGAYTNLAGVSIANNNFSITSFGDDLEVRSVADLKVSKFVSPQSPVRAGEQFTYTILVDNLGPSAAYNIVVTDTLIASGFVRANGCSLAIRTSGGAIDEFDCNFALSTGVFDLATFGANHLNPRSTTDMGRMIITINATADQPLDLTNVTTVTSDSEDPDTSNNMAMVAHSVSAVSDISVTKTAEGEVVDPTCGPSWIFDPNNPGAFPAAGFIASPTNVTAGRRIRYTLTVTNNGPSNAENVLLSDRLPWGVTVVPGSVAPSRGACETGTPGEPLDRMTCGIGTLPPGASATVTFEVLTDADLPAGVVLENDVFASADAFDSSNANNYAHTQTIVNTWADMEIIKLSVGENVTGFDAATGREIIEDIPGQATAGKRLRYELTVQNQGSSLAQNVQILDLLPGQTDTGLTHDPVTFLRSEGAYCRPASEMQEIGVFNLGDGKLGQVLWCSLGDMAPGERTTFDVYVQVDDSVPDGTTLTNGAFVWWGATSPPADPGIFLPFPFPQIPPALPTTDDPCLDDNFADTDTVITAVADVRVRKTAVASSLRPPAFERPDTIVAVPGGTLTYRFEVTNEGPSRALNVVLTDLLDPQLTYRYSTSATCTAGPPVTCDLGPLAPGETRIFDIVVEVAPNATPTEILNTAEVNWELPGGTPQGPVTDDEIVPVRELADLRIQKFGKRDGQVRAGDILTYTVIVDNYGPSFATATAIKDVLQSSFRFDLIDIMSDRDATCTTLANGALATNDLDAMPWPPVAAPPAFGVIAPTGIAMIQERLEADCNLRDDPATPEDESRLEVLQADGPPNSGRWILTMRVRAMEDQDINNRAEATSDATDPDLSNNSARVEHEITAVSDIAVTKMAVGEVQVVGQMGTIFDPATPGQAFPEAPNYTTSPTQVTAGRRISYTLTVTNFGPTYAENVILTDRLPEGVTIYAGSLTASQGSCETGTPGDNQDRLVCGLGGLSKNPGSNTATVTFEVITDPDLASGAMLENDAYAISDNFDPTNENNHVNTQTVVNTWADVELAKGAVGENKVAWDPVLRRFVEQDLIDQVTAGGELRYEMVVQNKGPSVARNVQILDSLPQFAGSSTQATTFLRAVGATCGAEDENANLIWCQVGDLAPGERRTFDIYVRVDEAIEDGTALVNVAQVAFGPSSPPAQTPNAAPPFDVPVLGLTNDPFVTNNLALNTTIVNAVADVYIEKVDIPAAADLDEEFEPDLAVAGQEHRYLITFGNKGWSTARNIAIQDILDAGEQYSRCEPFDIDDTVVCSEAGGVVNVDFLEVRNEQIIPAPGVLKAGEEFSFWLIVDVDSGFVLDEPDFIAEDTATISTSTAGAPFAALYGPGATISANDLRQENNTDTHDTLIIARADLEVTKTDIFAGPPAGPDNAFLQCDPVQPGGMITYNLTVTNNGPSDAAQVYVVDYLPAMGVALDPAQVVVNVTNGQVVEVRDDGRITVIVGNDNGQLGRMNAGSSETITIEVMVTQMAECGSFLANRAVVETRQNDVIWPPAVGFPVGNDLIGGGPRTPTMDPNPLNNEVVETTKVECPSVKVKKTVSYDGTCPGVDIRTINQTAQPVTFCFEITNDGTTWLDTIRITDTLVARTNGMPVTIFTDTITFGKDPKLPVAPGETVNRQVTIPHLTKECGIASDIVDVTAVAVNSGRTVYPCLTVEPARDERFVDIPCAGLDWRLQLPKLDTEMCDTWVQVQNVGCETSMAMLVVWGDPGFCPPQAAGPLKAECSGLIRPGAAWSFAAGQIPTGAQSAVVYSLSGTPVDIEGGGTMPFGRLVCEEFFFGAVGDDFEWGRFDSAYRQGQTWRGLDLAKYRGGAIAASVNRSCPDPVDPNVFNNAAYTGISSDMNGAYDPVTGAYMYYAPLIFGARGDLNTLLNIQNAGLACTSLEIWFKAQDDCLRPILGDVLSVAPGETVMFDPNTIIGPDWLGGAWVRSTQPLGMIVDTHGANHFTSYAGLPADNYELDFTFGNQINYAPLIYSEYQGWDTAIQVQNLSAITAAKVKVYFLDRSGDIITTLVDWVCPRGSQTFFLPLLANLPGGWVGSARVESQEWWSPGQPLVQPPRVSSIVLLERWSDPARTNRREAVAYNAQTECLLFDWQIAPGTKGGTSSGSAVFGIPLIAKGYNGITSEIGITNLVPKPGFTDFAIFMFDQNGLVDYVCQKLNEKQVEYIDLNTWGAVPQRFIGSMVVSAVFWEHDVFDSRGGFERNLVGLGAVAVERIGGTQGEPDVPGDESKAFEAIPLFDHFCPPVDPNCPGLPPRNQ